MRCLSCYAVAAVLVATATATRPTNARPTVSSLYRASFHFQAVFCYMTPRFEIGCTGGDDTILVLEDGVHLLGDSEGSVTCILHPTKGDQYRLCTATVTGRSDLEQSAQFAINFRCQGSTLDQLSSVAETVTTTAQCAVATTKENNNATSIIIPSIDYSASLVVYNDWSDGKVDANQLFEYSQVCQQGSPVQISSNDDDLAFACAQQLSSCTSTSSLSSDSNGCTLLLQSARSSFDGESLPEGAIRTLEQDNQGGKQQSRPGLSVVLVLIAIVAVVSIAIMVHLIQHRLHETPTRQPPQPSSTPKPVNRDSAKTLIETSSMTSEQKPTKSNLFVPSRGADVDPDQIQKYGFRVIRQHLYGEPQRPVE